jgi:hypothetical protein
MPGPLAGMNPPRRPAPRSAPRLFGSSVVRRLPGWTGHGVLAHNEQALARKAFDRRRLNISEAPGTRVAAPRPAAIPNTVEAPVEVGRRTVGANGPIIGVLDALHLDRDWCDHRCGVSRSGPKGSPRLTPNASALARPAGRPPLDLPATTPRSTARRPADPGAGAADGPGEPTMGVSTQSRAS